MVLWCRTEEVRFDKAKNSYHALLNCYHFVDWLGAGIFCIWSRTTDTHLVGDCNYCNPAETYQGWHKCSLTIEKMIIGGS